MCVIGRILGPVNKFAFDLVPHIVWEGNDNAILFTCIMFPHLDPWISRAAKNMSPGKSLY